MGWLKDLLGDEGSIAKGSKREMFGIGKKTTDADTPATKKNWLQQMLGDDSAIARANPRTIFSENPMSEEDMLIAQKEAANTKRLDKAREERDAKEKAEDGLKHVIDGAKLQCTLCTNPEGTLKVNYDTPSIQDKRTATVVETSSQSLVFTGNCKKSPYSKTPCAAAMQAGNWKNEGTNKIQEEYPILQRSTIKCNYGGTDVTIKHCGQMHEPENINTVGAGVPELPEQLKKAITGGYYFASDGLYLGVGNPANKTVYVVDVATANANGNDINKIHLGVAEGRIQTKLPFMTTELLVGETKIFIITALTIDVLKDNAHIIYGEAGSKTTEYDKMAHLLFNRETKTALKITKVRTGALGMDPKNGTKIYPAQDDPKIPMLKLNAKYGFNKYVVCGVHMPMSEVACDKFKETLDVNGVQIDGGNQNGNYLTFFKAKGELFQLQQTLHQTKAAFKAILDARLYVTKDPNPNYDGWKGEDGINKPIIGIPDVKLPY